MSERGGGCMDLGLGLFRAPRLDQLLLSCSKVDIFLPRSEIVNLRIVCQDA